MVMTQSPTGEELGFAGAGGGAVPDPEAWGATLGPALLEACQGHLGSINWFKADWQRGGATTGLSTWTFDGGIEAEAMVKFPVGPTEYRWTTAVGRFDPAKWSPESDAPTPRVLASGQTLGGYDLAWLVMERLRGHTLAAEWSKEAIEDLISTAAAWYIRTEAAAPIPETGHTPDWEGLIERGRAAIPHSTIEDPQRWNATLKKVGRALPALVQRWNERPINAWCHGDLHPGNAMRRALPGQKPAEGVCVLIDLALVHAGHWVEDALYLERICWGHKNLLHGIKPVAALAEARRALGLSVRNDFQEWANVRRVLMAACVPAFLVREGNTKYVRAALELLDQLLPVVVR